MISLMHQERYSSEAILDMSSLPDASSAAPSASNLSGMTVSKAASSLALTSGLRDSSISKKHSVWAVVSMAANVIMARSHSRSVSDLYLCPTTWSRMLCLPPSPFCLCRFTTLPITSPIRLLARTARCTSLSHHMCRRKGITICLLASRMNRSTSFRYARPLMFPSFSVPSSVNSMSYAPLDSVRRKNCSTILLQSTVPPLAAVCRNFSNCSPNTTFTLGQVRFRLEVENAGAIALRALSRSAFAVLCVRMLLCEGSTKLTILPRAE
mmetsp:Transcript_24768/g.54960  ORF Transcript_24768/g.54960 Transcript_24768/m.54960 type:complete len:267 (-) Transcript_24768:426-1226(-)